MKKLLLILIFILITLNLYAQTYPPKYFNHNKIKDCKNLLQKYTLEQLSAMISSGNFDDIYVGDYIEMEMTSDYGTEKVRWLVAGINYFANSNNTGITDNHIVLVAESCLLTGRKMNSTSDTSGGFAGSNIFVNILPKYNNAIINAFGANHVITYNNLLTNSVDATIPSMAGDNYTGASNGWAFASTTLCLMSEPQLTGTLLYSSSFYDIGTNNSQFPIFAQIPYLINTGRGFNNSNSASIGYWLSSVVNSARFAVVYGYGYVYHATAASAYSLRPYFLFK